MRLGASFDLAYDGKRRRYELAMLMVADVYAAGRVKERASIIQNKTQESVRFVIAEGYRGSLDR